MEVSNLTEIHRFPSSRRIDDDESAGTSTEAQGVRQDALRRLVRFQLGGECFLVDILGVREIVRLNELEVTRIPNCHDYILGLTSLRGRVAVVIDFARRMGLASAGSGGRLITVDINDQVVGFQVDEVGEIIDLSPEQIEPVDSASKWEIGIAPVAGQIATVLDLREAAAPDRM